MNEYIDMFKNFGPSVVIVIGGDFNAKILIGAITTKGIENFYWHKR